MSEQDFMTSTAGPQLATFSYFHFNPEVHEEEKAYEIIINLPSASSSPETYRRSNQEFEDRTVIVDDVRGHEDEFHLNVQGACWRNWYGPPEWLSLDGKGVSELGHEKLQDGYISEAEKFIKDEIEKQDNSKVDRVKIFDYKVRCFTFSTRKLINWCIAPAQYGSRRLRKADSKLGRWT